MNAHPIALAFVLGTLALPSATAQEDRADTAPKEADEAIHDELRALRTALVAALEERDVDQQLKYAHKDVVTTWQNNEVVRGHQGLREFLGKLNTGGNGVFRGYKVPPEPDDLTILHGGDTGIAFGRSVPHYKILGMEFDLQNRWTATLVKQDGQWVIAAYHVSANVLDNPVLQIAKRTTYWAGGIALVVGIALGLLLSLVARRMRASTT